MTVSWHVDDLKLSYVNPNQIDHFLKMATRDLQIN